MMRRPLLAVLGCIAVGGLLGGCAIDYPPPRLKIVNQLDESVVVTVRGGGEFESAHVDANYHGWIGIPDCRGDEILVEDQDGAVLGRMDEAACPDKTLTIRADGTLDYS